MIGREREISRLDECMKNEEAQFIAIYGRRRVGKTYLVNTYFNGRFDFKLTGVFDQPKSIQLKNFSIELKNQTGEEREAPNDWMDAFMQLRDFLESKSDSRKRVVFFDEMPWMDTPKGGFLKALEWFWNGWGNVQRNLIFVVCGSTASWMKRNLDKNRGGLYRRINARLYLEPFTLSETEAYLESKSISWSRYDIAECYMIMGGIPYYLSLLTPELSYSANIDNLFFRKRAELWDEFTFLYESLFQNSKNYIKIVTALSKKRSGMHRDEIMKETGLPENGLLTEMMDNLEYSGFVRILNDFGGKKKTYQLSDYYSLFYFRFIKDNYGHDEHFWTNTLDNPFRRSWAGLTFEQVCMDHLDGIKRKLGISGVLSSISKWGKAGSDEEPGAQIDLLIDRRDRVIDICEIKYSIGEYKIDKDYNQKIRNKIEIFRRETKSKSALQFVMITTYGIAKNKYSSIVTNEVCLDDLF